ncbi:MAG TPA: prolipoprotein diacylglyceryl transferase [Mycobacteriales bacterium]|nr:prolipoprotein diacylglyceryl transferase [Mycobacteriales bacterium]
MRASIPSPSDSELHLGSLPIHAYALCILVGVIVCIWLAEKRMQARGYPAGAVVDVAVWAVPFGIIGGRLYHVITDNQLYFRSGRDPWQAFEIWHGGLGIWGAISLGALGAWIGVRRSSVPIRFNHLADSLAVGIPIAQAIGRWGNWFNQELYGKPSDLPWALQISPSHREPRYADVATYQPTFLYECIWDLGTAGVVFWAERRFKLGAGRAFALYVAIYCVGRGWIEALRIDEAHRYLGLRLNDYTSIVLFVLAVGYIYARRNAPRQGPHEGPRTQEGADLDPVATPTAS